MADTRRLAAALAPFHEASKHLRATQARLSALVAAVTGAAAARTGNLERLPAAARFNPFAVATPLNPFTVLPKAVDAANAAEAGAGAGGRRTRPAPAAAARPGANASAAAAGLASAADSLRQAPGRAADLPPSVAARTAAAAARPETGRTLADTAVSGAATAAGAGTSSADTPSVGDLIGGLLQRHSAPRPDTRPTANAQPNASATDIGTYLQPATDTLGTLVAPLFLRPVPVSGAGPAEAGPQRASGRLPLLRAPSRLLGTAAPGTQATAAAAATAKTWTAAAEPASGQPAFGQPADGPAELAAELDRLLREQAWLRGVDLT